MNIRKQFVSVVLSVSAVLTMTGCNGAEEAVSDNLNPDYRVAMITNSGDITDQSFNQTTYEACAAYCEENAVAFTYKKPDGDTDYARAAMIDVAVAEGYNIIVMPGYTFAPVLIEATWKYPDVKFISLDMTAGNIIAAAVGDKYYADPDAYEVSDYYNTENTYCAVYQEEIPGYMAGYAAVKLGYRKLGYLGGQAVPSVMRFGYGYIQGINDAAEELGVEDEISVEYAYGGQYYGSTEITAAMDTWCSKGTEVIFSCGGGIFTSAAEAASKVGAKLIGVDSDQAPIIDVYGEGMTITSAMKGLGATVRAMLDSIIFTDTWEEHVGQIENLGLVSGTDLELNYVGLPEESTQWNEHFTVEDYHEMVRQIYEGELVIDSSIDHMPETVVEVNVREGSIM